MQTSRLRGVRAFVGVGLLVALGLAFAVSPFASGAPDGLEKVAIAQGFADTATDHALSDSPVADYALRGVDGDRLSTGLAGVIGVAVTFGVGLGAFSILRAVRRRDGGAPPGP